MTSQLALEDGAGVLSPTLDEPTSLGRLARELRRSKKGIVGTVVVLIVVVGAVAAPVIAPYSPTHQDLLNARAGPSFQHPFGNDDIGRDVLSRAIFGARFSVSLSLLVVAISAVVGSLLGALAGFFGSWIDQLIMRTTDFLLVFPWLLLALLLITIIGPGYLSTTVALVSLFWLSYARVVRAESLKLRELEFVQASRALGLPGRRILLRHILPNVAHTVIVLATIDIGIVILSEAGLTYLGLGVQPPTPTWGGMIAEGQASLAQTPWILFAPGAALIFAVIGFNLFGDWLRDVLDPTLRDR
jgi:peptide/nickel transport system permease protein